MSDTQMLPSKRPAAWLLVPVVLVLGLIAVFVMMARARLYSPVLSGVQANVMQPQAVNVAQQAAPSLEPYEGLGAWLDVFDFAPSYGANGVPAIDVAVAVEEMAAAEVKTIYVQAAKWESRTPGLIEDSWVLAELLLAAHANDMQVVAWYLPRFDGGLQDGERIDAMRRFEVLGHTFDGIALDIEAGAEPSAEVLATQNTSLIGVSQLTRALAGDMPVGAIVLPPPLLEDVNDKFWPEFPWAEIGEYYDVWLPMSYWSGRSNESGYGGGYNYNLESTNRIRERIGDPGAAVHGIGGIGGVAGERDFSAPEILASIDDFPLFAESLADSGSIGGSIYDWQTQDATARELMTALFTTGVAANLPAAPEWPPAQ